MDNIIFSIIEEDYSNGKLIVEKLSKELKIPFYYDKDIIELASKNSNINKKIFYTIEEWKLNKFISPFPADFSIGFNIPYFTDFVPIQDKVFIEKSKAIKSLVKEKSCIIFSKASNYILKDYENCIKVLIYSKDIDRLKVLKNDKAVIVKKYEKYLKKLDKKLLSYYGYYTLENFDNKKTYDIFLNSSSIGIDNCVNILKILFNSKIRL